MCEDLHLQTPLLTLPSGLEVSWLPLIIHSFSEGQSSRIYLSFQPCAISGWLRIGGGEPKGTKTSLGDSLYLLSRLFPELSLYLSILSLPFTHSSIHPSMHSFSTHSPRTSVPSPVLGGAGDAMTVPSCPHRLTVQWGTDPSLDGDDPEWAGLR